MLEKCPKIGVRSYRYDTMQFGKGVVSPLNYKEAIVEIVGKIHSERILKRIYKFVLYLYTHETGS